MTRTFFILAILFCFFASGCLRESGEALKIGSKNFTEQKLLAEMLALLAEKEGLTVSRAIPYGDSRQSLFAIQKGIIDAYPEYSGSLLALNGGFTSHDLDIRDHAKVIAAVREIIAPLGLQLLEPFGLNNSFAIAVRRDVASQYDLSSISDLARLPESIRVAADEGFLSRSTDGLYAMARRYGLQIGTVQRFPIEERFDIYNALVEHRVDVAEVFTTDAYLEGYGVTLLEDDLGFFPPYEPAPLVRSDVLTASPRLADAWDALAGKIDTAAIRQLITRVEQGGEDYRDVARDHLQKLGLLPDTVAPSTPREELVLAVNPLSDLGFLPMRAAKAIRQVMPARRLVVERVAVPATAVRDGKARFGLVGAEGFYQIGADNQPIRVEDMEAVGVVGNRFVHLVTRKGPVNPKHWTKIGTGPEDGSSWRVTRLLLNALKLADKIETVPIDDPVNAAAMLADHQVDALLLMVEQGHAGLLKLLRSGDCQLVDSNAFRGTSPALQYPFLRPAQIPANTYPGQPEALDTLTAQVVLATRVPRDNSAIGESGPGFVPGVFTRLPQRLPFETARRLSEALDAPEEVDPVLPRSPGLAPETPQIRPRIQANASAALMNALAIAFLIAMVILCFRKLPQNPALTSGQETPNKSGSKQSARVD